MFQSKKNAQSVHTKRNLLLICSIIVCTLIITITTLITKFYINQTGKTDDSAIIVAKQTDQENEEHDRSLWYGNFSGTYDRSYLTIEKIDGTKFKFTMSITQGKTSDKVAGTASLTGQNTARYKGSDGLILLFSMNQGIVSINKDPYCVDRHPLSFCGEYINIDGNIDVRKNQYFNRLRSFGSDITYKFDINRDGKADSICYKAGALTVNKYTYRFTDSSENLDIKNFYMIDIDTDDNYINILIMDDGPSCDPVTTILTYTPDNKFSVSSFGCNVAHLEFDNHGLIQGNMRLDLLQTWFASCKWSYKNNILSFIKQKYYDPVALYNPNTKPPHLNKSIKVYQKDDLKSTQIELQPQDVNFLKTDNIHWVQLVGQREHTTGWIYLKDYNVIPNQHANADQIFSNLIQAE